VDWVVKTIVKRGRSKDEIEAFRKEIATMKSMDHPNIIRFHDAFENQDELFIGTVVTAIFPPKYVSTYAVCWLVVMELCTGGDLFDQIEELQRTKKIPNYSESECSKILKQVQHIVRSI
jgi:serine/threonine protein kinase